MMNIKTQICHNIFRSASSLMAFQQFLQNLSKAKMIHSPEGGNEPLDSESQNQASVSKPKPFRRHPHVGRNDPCPCGSGKKFKHCCGILSHSSNTKKEENN